MMVSRGMKVETYFTADGDDLRGINTPEDLDICEKILLQRSANILPCYHITPPAAWLRCHRRSYGKWFH